MRGPKLQMRRKIFVANPPGFAGLWRKTMKKSLFNCCTLMALLFLAGCINPIGADKVSPRQAYQRLHPEHVQQPRCSAETMCVLNRYDLETAFRKNPDATLQKLQAIACTDDRRDLLMP